MYNDEFVNSLKEALNGLRAVHAVGEEWCSYIGQIPAGGVPYCGQEVLRETYSALWAYAQNQGLVKSESEWQSIYSAQGGNVPFYSSGDGSSTFRMPRLVGYVRGASGQSEAGAYVKEGLPDHTHKSPYDFNDTLNAHVASANANAPHPAADVLYTTIRGYGKDSTKASESNPIYGNSDHVTPETSVVLFGVYAFGEVNNVGALDAGTLASAVARVESNIVKPARYVTEKWSSGTSWYTKYSDGWVEQGGKVTVTTTTITGTRVVMFVEFSSKDYQRLVGAVEFSNNTTNYVPIASIASNATIDTLGFSVVRWYSQDAGTGIQTPGDVWWEAKGYAK